MGALAASASRDLVAVLAHVVVDSASTKRSGNDVLAFLANAADGLAFRQYVHRLGASTCLAICDFGSEVAT
jgi:hypothetical protein